MTAVVAAVSALLFATPPPVLAPTSGASATEPTRSRGGAPLDAEERGRRDAVVGALVEADARATEAPDTAEPALTDALAAFADAAPLVGDDEAQRARVFAQLSLARVQLFLGRAEDAATTMDEALRTARGDALPVEQFGPDLEALYEQRRAELGPPGQLVLECHQPCRAWVDERAVSSKGAELPAGGHRLWIEAQAKGPPVLRQDVMVPGGERVVVVYGEPAPPELTPPPTVSEPGSDRAHRPDRRMLPRWASVLGMGLGAGSIVAGGVLVGVDHRCPDLSDPRTTPCPRILNTDAGGWIALGVGATALIVGTVILVIDERRARRSRSLSRYAQPHPW